MKTLMLKNNQNQNGFTIIEVVLVLAIAGLIFLMVFLALPALQRSQRDTQRKQEITALGAAIQSYKANNRNKLPMTNERGKSKYYYNINREGADIGFLTKYWKTTVIDSVEIMPWNHGWATSVRVPTTSGIVLHMGGKCKQLDDGTWTTSAQQNRQSVAVYIILESITPAKNYYGNVGANYCQDF